MKKYKVIAKSHLSTYPHTWTEGLDYEVVERDYSITIASNEGQLNYTNDLKDEVLMRFTRVDEVVSVNEAINMIQSLRHTFIGDREGLHKRIDEIIALVK